MRFLSLVIGLLITGTLVAEESKTPAINKTIIRPPDGRYSPDPKGRYFAGEIITIKGESFQYTRFSDAVSEKDEPTYSGKVIFYSDRVFLNHPGIPFPYRIPGKLNGIPVLWTWKEHKAWEKSGKIGDDVLYLEKKKKP